MHMSITSLFSRHQIMTILVMIILASATLYAQRNGDDLAFQGLAQPNEISARALALAGAYVTQSGDVAALHYNPAGLSGINKLQVSIGGASSSQTWRDNQVWYPGGAYKFINQYLERLYIPDPSFNGIWSDSLGSPLGLTWNPDDFKTPVQGKDAYSKEAADAETDLNSVALNHLSVALPVKLGSRKFVIAAGYSRAMNILDYDWNGSHLNPHWGTSELLTYAAEKGDTLRSDWSVYTRQRTGAVHQINAAVAFAYNQSLQFGLGVQSMFGSSDDELSLDRVGYFNFIHADGNGLWAFTYDDTRGKIVGTSDYAGFQMNVSGLFTSKSLDIGVQAKLPYTLERKWNYTTSGSLMSHSISGTDKVKMPAAYILGLGFKPTEKIAISFQFEKTDLSDAEFEMATEVADTSKNLPIWADQQTLRFGIEYRLFDNFSMLLGYRNGSTPFVPQGVAIRDAGPPSSSYTIGFSLDVLGGRLDAGYEFRQLKYYDVYFTSRNYTLVQGHNILFGYTYSL